MRLQAETSAARWCGRPPQRRWRGGWIAVRFHHCADNPGRRGFSLPGGKTGRWLAPHAMPSPFKQLLVRWIVLALGVMLATKIVRGISCEDGATLLAVVLLLSFFNAIL